MLLNLDIWHGILDHLVYPQDSQTLRCLAVTSRCLSSLALDNVWRNGENSLTIVSVINSFATSPNEPFLEYIHEGGDSEAENEEGSSSLPGGMAGDWHLNSQVPYAARKRAFEYLVRIKKLRTSQHGRATKLVSLWLILSASLGCHRPLLPNLHTLEITLSGGVDNPAHDPINHLIPLMSPSLKVLRINTEGLRKHKAAQTILNLAYACGCSLEKFTYDGGPIHQLPDTIVLYTKLEKLQIPLYRAPQHKASITVAKFLAMLPSLRSLTCNLAAFPRSVGDYRLCHTSLRRIEIKSPAKALHELFRECVFPSVTEVRILRDGKIPSFEGLESSCPNTCKLELSVNALANRDGDQPLQFEHLMSLLSLPIQEFNLNVPEHNLVPADLHAFASSWKNVRSFQITSATRLDALPSLVAFSCHPKLEYLHFYLPLCYLLDDISKVPDLMESYAGVEGSRSRLHALYFARSASRSRQGPTVTIVEKRMLVKYLFLLFPSLVELRFSGRLPTRYPDEDATLAELQNILLELRRERYIGIT